MERTDGQGQHSHGSMDSAATAKGQLCQARMATPARECQQNLTIAATRLTLSNTSGHAVPNRAARAGRTWPKLGRPTSSQEPPWTTRRHPMVLSESDMTSDRNGQLVLQRAQPGCPVLRHSAPIPPWVLTGAGARGRRGWGPEHTMQTRQRKAQARQKPRHRCRATGQPAGQRWPRWRPRRTSRSRPSPVS